MSGEELFKEGQLAAAIEAQTKSVKKKPTDLDARYMLFVMLCFAGELERADKQLDVLGNMDEKTMTGSLIYHQLLASEWERRKVWEEAGHPTLPPDPPDFASKRVAALEKLRRGDGAAAEALLDEAIEATPDITGKLDGESFEGLRDYDDVLASTLEVFAGGRYLWVPLSFVRRIEFTAPTRAIDWLWRQAKLEDVRGDIADVHLPVNYQASYAQSNESIQLGRATDWVERGEIYSGVGQHLFLTVRGDERVEHSILDLTRLEIDQTS